MTKFYRNSQTRNQEKLTAIENNLEYTAIEKIKSIVWDGFIIGQVHDTYSGIGAISSDLCLYGDVRDLGNQGWKHLTEADDFDGVVASFSAAGIGLSSTAFINGSNALAKNTIKYLKTVPGSINTGLLKTFLSGKISPAKCDKIWHLLKRNEWSIPRTTSCLSNIHSIKHLDTATELISRHKRTGNVFINITGDNGLALYSFLSIKWKDRLINAFKRYPKAIIGITKSHLVIHAIKTLHKHDIVSIILPITTLAIGLSALPQSIVWIIFIASSGYLFMAITRKSKRSIKRKKENEKCLTIVS